MTDTQDVERVRAMSIADLMGAKIRGRMVQIKCPLPTHNDGRASMTLYDDNSYHCYGCDAHGHNFIDFLEAMGYKFGAIMEEFGTPKTTPQ